MAGSDKEADMSAVATVTKSGEAAALKGFFIGSIVGTALVLVVYGGLVMLAGMDFMSATAVGLFTAFWGGPGFGGMLGAVLAHVRYEERTRGRR
jgi:hypothetical protein